MAPILSKSILSILKKKKKKTFAYLHYASNMFTKFEKIRSETVGAVDYTL